jgi:hypothetical protein
MAEQPAIVNCRELRSRCFGPRDVDNGCFCRLSEDFKTRFFRRSREFSVAQRIPTKVFRLFDCMVSEKRAEWSRSAVGEENEHLAARLSFQATRGKVQHRSDLIPGQVEPLGDIFRVPRKTHAPLTFPGTLSTAGHSDQSRAAITSSFRLSYTRPANRRSATLRGGRSHTNKEKCEILSSFQPIPSARISFHSCVGFGESRRLQTISVTRAHMASLQTVGIQFHRNTSPSAVRILLRIVAQRIQMR